MKKDEHLLATIAYIDFKDKNNKIFNLENNKQTLDKKFEKEGLATQDLEYFFKNYQILDQRLNTPSGFSALIVKDKRTQETILAVRGTEPSTWADVNQDLTLAVIDIPLNQLIDAKNYIEWAMAPKNGTYYLNIVFRKIYDLYAETEESIVDIFRIKIHYKYEISSCS